MGGALHAVAVAGVVVDDEQRLLILHRRDLENWWEPPGGVLELDEDILQGLKREVREETGVDVEVDRLTGVYKNRTELVVCLVFRCAPKTPALSSSEEASEIRWLPIEDAKRLLAADYVTWVEDALGEDRAHVRSQEGPVKAPASGGRR